MTPPIAQLTDLGSQFAGVAATDPLSAILLLLGAVLTLGSAGFVGLLALRAVVDPFVPKRVGQVWRPGS